jgi:hypothetical protein
MIDTATEQQKSEAMNISEEVSIEDDDNLDEVFHDCYDFVST